MKKICIIVLSIVCAAVVTQTRCGDSDLGTIQKMHEILKFSDKIDAGQHPKQGRVTQTSAPGETTFAYFYNKHADNEVSFTLIPDTWKPTVVRAQKTAQGQWKTTNEFPAVMNYPGITRIDDSTLQIDDRQANLKDVAFVELKKDDIVRHAGQEHTVANIVEIFLQPLARRQRCVRLVNSNPKNSLGNIKITIKPHCFFWNHVLVHPEETIVCADYRVTDTHTYSFEPFHARGATKEQPARVDRTELNKKRVALTALSLTACAVAAWRWFSR